MVLLSVNVFAAEVSELLTNKITLNAEDASVSTIISTMAKLSNCNIVLAMDTADKDEKAEEKKITIQLKEVPIEQALALVVKSIGLSYRLVGEKTFIVGEKARIEEEIGERTYVLTLNYVDVNKIMPGESIAIEGQNAILVRANPQTFTEISKRIEEIDVPQKQIEIRCRLIEISVSESEKYGIDWSKLNHLTTILAEDAKSSSGTGLPYNFTDATGDTPYGDLSVVSLQLLMLLLIGYCKIMQQNFLQILELQP
jgi:type IV pilus assembly protein PilQ